MNRNLDGFEAPPRRVRWDVKAQVLFLPIKWSFLFLFLMAPLAMMVVAEPYYAFRLAVSETATTSAQVTNTNSGKNSSYQATYHVNGKTYSIGGSGYARDGTVVYVVSRPDISRLEGKWGFFYWLISLPLLAAYIYALSYVRQRLLKQSEVLWILSSGVCAQAEITVLDVTETAGGKKRYHMEFTFTPPGTSEPVTVAVRKANPGGLGDEHKEDIVYHPLFPQHPVFLDTLPGKVAWRAGSGWVSLAPHMTVVALVLPLATLWAVFKSFQFLF